MTTTACRPFLRTGALCLAVAAGVVTADVVPASAAPSAPVAGAVVWVQTPASDGFTGDLWTETASGSGARRLTTDERANWPAWSHDGRFIAYADAGVIKIITSTGAPVRTVTPGYHPSWSPNDRQLVFTLGGVLDRVAAGGGRVSRAATPPRGCTDTQPNWSPVGNQVLYQQNCGATRRFEVLDLHTGVSAEVAGTDRSPGGVIASPRWMPDGRHISFVATCWAPGHCVASFANVVTMPAHYTPVRTLVTHHPGCQPNFDCDIGYLQAAPAPDGKDFLVTYWAASGGNVFVLAALHARVNRVYSSCCFAVPIAIDPSWGPAAG